LQDEDAFFTDYAASHKKLSELGFTPPSSSLKEAAKASVIVAQSAVGVAVTAAVVILSYLYEVHKRVE
jgi:L-ascorbate peroxidase